MLGLFSTNHFLNWSARTLLDHYDAPENYPNLRKFLDTVVEYEKDNNVPAMETANQDVRARPLTLAEYMLAEYKKRGHNIARFTFHDGLEKKIIDVTWAEIEDASKPLTCFCIKDWTSVEALEQEKIANKLEKILLTAITHELRSPLHGIIGMLEEIEYKLQEIDEKNVSKYCSVAINSGKLMMSLINDILDFSHIEAKKFKLNYLPFDANTLVHESCEIFRMHATRRNIVLKSTSTSLPIIYSDKERYKQILLNLLSNAMKFTFEGSVEVLTSYNQARDKLKTKVKDTGIGIAEREKDKLFKAFSKLDNSLKLSSQGIGVGLVVCKKLTEALGGEIKAKSKLGEGSVFSFTIKNQRQHGTYSTLGTMLNLPERQKPMQSTSMRWRTLSAEGQDIEQPDHQTVVGRVIGPLHKRSAFPMLPPDISHPEEEDKEAKVTPSDLEEFKHANCKCNKILIVDDNEINIFLFTSFLARLNISCDTVLNFIN